MKIKNNNNNNNRINNNHYHYHHHQNRERSLETYTTNPTNKQQPTTNNPWYSPMAISKVQTPDLESFISRTRNQQHLIGRHIQTQHRQLMTIQRQIKLERIVIQHFDGVI